MNATKITSRFVVVLCLGIFAVTSCSKKGTGGDADDGNSPYNILDMEVSSVTDSSITLAWTATGDDRDQGTASSYDIRHWHTYINSTNWDSATQVVGEPHPRAAGLRDSVIVTGLAEDSTYYFGMHVCDEAGNCATSNSPRGTCFRDAVMVFPDHALDSAIRGMISKPTGDIMRSDLMAFEVLEANQAGIVSLSGIEGWTTLKGILGGGNSITDLTPLSGLVGLQGLGLSGNAIVNITPLSTLVNLELLHLRANSVVDLTALTGMTKLKQLDITQNAVTDLAPLVANTGLAAGDTVWVGFNPLSAQSLTVDVPALQARGVTVLGL